MTIDITHIGFMVRIAIALFVGLPLLILASRALTRVLGKHVSTHISILIGNIALYVGCTFLAVSVLHDLGFNLSAFLGAAGIIGIAVGFAAQTSVSNIISGLFLVLEGSCAIGDQISHETLVGTIESIDLLSVKIRTLDNMFVRIPNEFFIKQVMVNKSYYPIRIVEFKVGVPIEYDVHNVMRLLHEVASTEALFLSTPTPKIHLFEVNSSAVIGVDCPSFQLTNEIKVEIGVNKQVVKQARDIFVAAAQRKLQQENIKGTIVRL